MAWDKVDAGQIGSELYVIERRAFQVPVPGIAGGLSIQLRSYRWRLTASDGTVPMQGTAKTRASARDSVRLNAGHPKQHERQ